MNFRGLLLVLTAARTASFHASSWAGWENEALRLPLPAGDRVSCRGIELFSVEAETQGDNAHCRTTPTFNSPEVPGADHGVHHLAIIPDGNGRSGALCDAVWCGERTYGLTFDALVPLCARWASARGLPRIVGHTGGAARILEAVQLCIRHHIRYLTVYAFSTENWGREAKEVAHMFALIETQLIKVGCV